MKKTYWIVAASATGILLAALLHRNKRKNDDVTEDVSHKLEVKPKHHLISQFSRAKKLVTG